MEFLGPYKSHVFLEDSKKYFLYTCEQGFSHWNFYLNLLKIKIKILNFI